MTDISTLKKTLARNGKAAVKCEPCNIWVGSTEELEQHYRESYIYRNHPSSRWHTTYAHPLCHRCSNGFKDDAALSEHEKSYHEWICDCGKQVDRARLQQHIKLCPARRIPQQAPSVSIYERSGEGTESSVTLTSSRPPPTVEFTLRSSLNTIHLTAVPIAESTQGAHRCMQCTLCKTWFAEEEHLLQHYLRSAVHPKCANCQRGFADVQALNEHTKAKCRTHYQSPQRYDIASLPDEKPALSTSGPADSAGCAMPVAQLPKNELQVSATAGGRLRCDVCNISFSQPKKLRAHNRKMLTPGHPRCKVCGIGMGSQARCDQHMAKVHGVRNQLLSPAKNSAPPPVKYEEPFSLDKDEGTAAMEPKATSLHEHEATPHEVHVCQTTDRALQACVASSTAPTSMARDVEPCDKSAVDAPVSNEQHRVPTFQNDSSTGHITTLSIKRMEDNACTSPPRTSTPLDLIDKHREGSEASFAVSIPTKSIRELSPLPSEVPISEAASSPARGVSWHCRSCNQDPCQEPTATVCGHIFCRRCIIREIAEKMQCPVCGRLFLLKLQLDC